MGPIVPSDDPPQDMQVPSHGDARVPQSRMNYPTTLQPTAVDKLYLASCSCVQWTPTSTGSCVSLKRNPGNDGGAVVVLVWMGPGPEIRFDAIERWLRLQTQSKRCVEQCFSLVSLFQVLYRTFKLEWYLDQL
jgi:hypothetical protein